MSYYLTPALALSQTMQKMEPIRLNGTDTYSEIIARFEYVVVRDTLHRLGISFETADWYASNTKGCARTRFRICKHKLRKELEQVGSS